MARGIRDRVVGFVRSLFGRGGSPEAGVREPRRPRTPSRGGAAVLDAPPAERRDTRAVGSDDS
jgi:hypothetical protein